MTSRRTYAAAGPLALILGVLASAILLVPQGGVQTPLMLAAVRNETTCQFRGAIRIDNTGNTTTLTDYAIEVVLDETNFEFDKAGEAGADLRFSDEDGTTPLQYWLQ